MMYARSKWLFYCDIVRIAIDLGAQLTELLMTCILYVVLSGDLLEGSFPGATMEKTGWMLLATCFLLPCAFLTDLTAVSTLSFWNTVSHIVINAIVLLYCCTQIGNWAWGAVRFTFDIHTFPTVLGNLTWMHSWQQQAMNAAHKQTIIDRHRLHRVEWIIAGIVVFSYTSHIFLPGLEGSLQDRSMFRPMLKWSHVAAAFFKATFGFFGFLTFAEYTQEEISNNLPGQQFKVVLNLILVIKALL